MNRARLTFGIVLIFILGGLAGALALQLYNRQHVRDRPPRNATLEERVDFIMERLAEDLDLSADQASRVRPLVATTEKSILDIRERIGPEIRRIHDRNFEDIREKLDPRQQKKLDEIRQRIRDHRRNPRK